MDSVFKLAVLPQCGASFHLLSDISWIKSKGMISNCRFLENLDGNDVDAYLLLKVSWQMKAYQKASL